MLQRLPFWPRGVGNQCLLMLVVGALLGSLLPSSAGWLDPVGVIFLQVSQIVVMPYLICQLIVGLGKLSQASLRQLLSNGTVVLIGIWVLGGLFVLLLPLSLPQLVYSGFFYSQIFRTPADPDLLRTYIPDNIFTALAADNFPASVLFSAVLGVLLQSMDNRGDLLPALEVIRGVFERLNKLVVKIIPYGILALSAKAFASLSLEQLIRIQGFFQLSLLALVGLSLLLAGLLVALTPLDLGAIWRISRGPLALTASSANLLIALPMLVENLREELGRCPAAQARPERAAEAARELAPLVSIGFSLPSLGQVVSLLFLPFAGWYMDKPLGTAGTLRMLATGIPASVAGIKSVVRQELQKAGLPLDLRQLIDLNGVWLYRVEKVLALEGLVVLGVLVYMQAIGALRLRPLRLLLSLVSALGLTGALALGSRAALAQALGGTYSNDRKLLALSPLVAGPAPASLAGPRAEAVTLQAIVRRGVLRVGLREDGLPWAYRNSAGRLVGYDVDLMQTLARSLGVRLEVLRAPLSQLESLLDQQRIDMAVGGIQVSPQRALRHRISRGYQRVHMGLVVPDAKVGFIQDLQGRRLGRPLEIAVSDQQAITPELRDQIARSLAGPQGQLTVNLIPIASKDAFFSPQGQRSFDALFTSAEGGSAWAVIHPRTTLLASFQDAIANDVVILVAGDDPTLVAYIDTWLAREQSRGLMDRLFRHWILVQDDVRADALEPGPAAPPAENGQG
ncbi:MAG: cation:dicarboxylase symporter family transporter [Synechococcaceae cyanobacterium]|nr:cation:dicarboxylase symporter family transporter [Synechococcaceae cyanobacterium]